MRRLAIFLPNWVGDAVMATPALAALRRRYGDAVELIGIARPTIADVLAGARHVDRFWPRDERGTPPSLDWRACARRLRAARVDGTVHFTNDFASALAARFAGVPLIAGYARNHRGFLLTVRLEAPRRGRRWLPVSAMNYYLRLAQAIGADPAAPRVDLGTTPADEADADRAWATIGLAVGERPVVINSSGAFGSAKLWPEASCSALAAKVARGLRRPVVVLAGPAEHDRARRIAAAAGHPRVAALDGAPLSIGLSKAVVRRACVLVSTDSGPRHFGAAFGVPVVALFGPTDPAWSDTRHAHEIRLAHPIACRPCAARECPLGHHDCMRKLSVDEVAAAVASALGEPGGQEPAGENPGSMRTIPIGARA